MNTEITFTPAQLIAWVLAVCAGIACIATAANWIAKAWRAARAPDQKQNDRLKKLEDLCAKQSEMQDSTDKRIEALEEGNRVTQEAILALLTHSLDGNEMESMRTAKQKLQEYLIQR
jgi:hypothetical protein